MTSLSRGSAGVKRKARRQKRIRRQRDSYRLTRTEQHRLEYRTGLFDSQLAAGRTKAAKERSSIAPGAWLARNCLRFIVPCLWCRSFRPPTVAERRAAWVNAANFGGASAK